MEVTIYTLAKELNMTPSMVSRAFNPNAKINEDKRRIVLKAAEKYNFSPNKFASRLSMKSVHIGVLLNSTNPFIYEKMIAGVKDAHAELKDYKIQYDITHLNPLESTDSDIRKALERYKSYDGVIVTGMSAERYTELINELYEANPNVVQVQAINQEAKYLFASKHDETLASNLAAEFLHNCLKRSERKNILLFTGDMRSALHLSAANAFQGSCDALGLNLLSAVDMKDSEEYLASILDETFSLYGNQIDGIYITSGISGALCRYLEKKGYDIPFVAFDTHEDIKSYMKKDIISATIAQNVGNQMKMAFELLAKYLITGNECPKIVYTDIQLVLKSNMHQFD